MKKRFSDKQIISILREADAGVSVRELCRKHAISDATFIPSQEVWQHGGARG
ncbi:ORF1 ISSen4 [Klebsiella pneumoniae]|nr:ORF1 ISSen4 [Klebsiella pneumoniae]